MGDTRPDGPQQRAAGDRLDVRKGGQAHIPGEHLPSPEQEVAGHHAERGRSAAPAKSLVEIAQSRTADEDQVGEVESPQRHVLVLSPELLAQGRIEGVERVGGNQDHGESRVADELEEVRRVDRSGFKHSAP